MNPEERHLSGYERLKIVGKGAFGTAVLHRRQRDSQLVIIKEVDMLPLSGSERQLALNEVKVLSTLQHPNIIRYLDSFEEDGVLMIEMEYADGGTLHQYLSRMERPMEEKDVLDFFQQIADAVLYMHERRVLHRDLKTANIFLTHEQRVKVGDFGISKMAHTRAVKADTLVGTPYYISPEMCQGQPYGEKSDVWALGCVLYEMVCLHRTFEGTNLPALVHKIMKGQFAPIGGQYSPEFRRLVGDLLQREPKFRPSARDIVHRRLPPLMVRGRSPPSTTSSRTLGRSDRSVAIGRRQRSVLFRLEFSEGEVVALTPMALPPQHLVRQLSMSDTHTMAVTSDGAVYGWGDNSKGQLGLDPSVLHVEIPTLVDGLRDKAVSGVGTGLGFSVLACRNGLVMTCGDGSDGCLGHGDWKSVSKPKIVEKLLSVDVSAVACGPHHVVVVGGGRWAFSWGSGGNGRLGHGTETSLCSPAEVTFPEAVVVCQVRCGVDGTAFLTVGGQVWACGNNAHDKLGLDDRAHFWSGRKEEVRQRSVPSRGSRFPGAVVDASLGPDRSAFLLDDGRVATRGSNSGDPVPRNRRIDGTVDAFHPSKNRRVTMLSCGSAFTVAGTSDNALYWWGEPPGTVRRDPVAQRLSDSIVWDVPRVGGTVLHRAFSTTPTGSRPLDCPREVSGGGGISTSNTDSTTTTKPRQILMLYASPRQVADGETVALSAVHCQKSSVLVLVSTTAAVSHAAHCPYDDGRRESSADVAEGERPSESPSSTMETVPTVPEWLRKELLETDDSQSRVVATSSI